MTVGADRDVADRIDRVERAARTQIDAVAVGLEAAGRRDRVLRLQRLLHLIEADAEGCQFCVRYLDIDLLVLQPDQTDLGHVRHAQQFEFQALGVVAQLCIAVAVAGQCIDIAERVAEFIVEERAERAGRQRVADVADLLAHLVEHVGYAFGRNRILDHDEHLRLAWTRIAAQIVEFRDLLQLLFDLLGHLLGDFRGGRARPLRLHDHDLERERRIFRLTEAEVGPHAEHGQYDDEVAQQRLVAQRPRGQIEIVHADISEAVVTPAGCVRPMRPR